MLLTSCRVCRIKLAGALLDAACPLMSGNGDADMVWTNALACSGDFLLRLAVGQSKDPITETGLAAIAASRFRRGGASTPA